MAQGPAAPDPLAPYTAHARATWWMYTLVIAGAVFVVAPLLLSPETDCREVPCPVWVRTIVFAIGVLMGGGALLALVRKVGWGSRVDFKSNDIVWWYGAQPAKEKRIAIGSIGRIRVEGGEGVTLWLYDRNGRKIFLPTECVRAPVEWAAALGARFPSIQVELPGRRTKGSHLRSSP
jgi:hypothetical protein